jgi:predicted site-specific integrase-resolvase
MPVTIDGVTLFRISEALNRAGVSRATYFRWVRQGRVHDSRYKDRNGRRLFTAEEVRELERVAHRLIESPTQLALRMSGDRRGLER